MERAKAFYGRTLGVEVADIGPGLLALRATNGYAVLINILSVIEG